MLFPDAKMRVERVDVKLLSTNIGYIMGAGDSIPEALEVMGARVTLLSPQDVSAGDLSQYDAIVAGVRAHEARPDLLGARERLIDYVAQGGTLVVQYDPLFAGPGRGGSGPAPNVVAPYPLQRYVNTPDRQDRVTHEDAPMTLLLPDHPLLQAPNHIAQADFSGWVQERGLYFMSKWDEHYDAVLATHDPDQEPQAGGLLYARYGKGVYVFAGYAFFRQLPAGVPGAYRLFANIVSAGKIH
jgi:hypothetical protein